MKTTGSRSDQLLRRAYDVLPGASLGTYYLPEGAEFVVERGDGARVYDLEGRAYVDYVLGSGPMILGHAHPAVVGAVAAQLQKGTSYYALNEPAILLAERIVAAVPCAQSLKFCGSGAEATFYALRLARAVTGRDKVLKFEGGYHGHHDYSMMSTTPSRREDFPRPVPDSAGIPRRVLEDVLVAPFNDLDETTRIMEAHREALAAVIVEPQSRLIDPKPGFLEGLREATRRVGALLIFDEVVTGFRLAYGGAQEVYGVTPDLACYGKIIGGGLPLAAVAGRREVMELANPRKKGAPDYTYMSGTFNGNALAASAGLATLTELEKPAVYDRLNRLGLRMREGLAAVAARAGLAAQVMGRGPLANIYFASEPVSDYRSAEKADKVLTQLLTKELIRRGVLANMPAKMYISLAHSDADVDETLLAVESALRHTLQR
jgi:glutamate-1-semialdehyde 2,1-aminomutase